jgi:hypothetical protein
LQVLSMINITINPIAPAALNFYSSHHLAIDQTSDQHRV